MDAFIVKDICQILNILLIEYFRNFIENNVITLTSIWLLKNGISGKMSPV